MNPVLVLTHNCLEMTKRCVESANNQDIETNVFIFDNGSTDGTVEWGRLASLNWTFEHRGTLREFWQSDDNAGVSRGWNTLLTYLFKMDRVDHVLVLNNDTVIPPWFYWSLLSSDGPFISGVSVDNMDTIANPEPRKELAPCPDFSAWLMRRECWDKVGTFDESMVLYAGDLDYHIRAHRAGVRLMNAGVPFYHKRSSTLNNAAPREKRQLQMQADSDRLNFYEKWGCHAWAESYAAMFDENFFGVGIDKVMR